MKATSISPAANWPRDVPVMSLVSRPSRAPMVRAMNW